MPSNSPLSRRLARASAYLAERHCQAEQRPCRFQGRNCSPTSTREATPVLLRQTYARGAKEDARRPAGQGDEILMSEDRTDDATNRDVAGSVAALSRGEQAAVRVVPPLSAATIIGLCRTKRPACPQRLGGLMSNGLAKINSPSNGKAPRGTDARGVPPRLAMRARP